MVKALAFLFLVFLASSNGQVNNNTGQELMDKFVAELKSQPSTLSRPIYYEGLLFFYSTEISSNNMFGSINSSLQLANSSSNRTVNFKLFFCNIHFNGSVNGGFVKFVESEQFRGLMKGFIYLATVDVTAVYNSAKNDFDLKAKYEPSLNDELRVKWTKKAHRGSIMMGINEEESLNRNIFAKFVDALMDKVNGVIFDFEFKLPVNSSINEENKIMTHSFDACDNFYKFACSRKKNEPKLVSLQFLSNYLSHDDRKKDAEPIQFIHRLFKKCIDQSK